MAGPVAGLRPEVLQADSPGRRSDLGAAPIEEGSGYARLHARMQDSGALFGAGVRGHYFFGDLGGDDDAMLAACR